MVIRRCTRLPGDGHIGESAACPRTRGHHIHHGTGKQIGSGLLYTEYFADGTVPTESCNVHYEGYICAYDLMPVSPNCPFPVYGTAEVPLIEDPALQRGSSVVGADGQVQQAATSNHCMHDDAFFANPDYEAALNIQRLEIEQRNAAAGILPEGEGAVTPGTDLLAWKNYGQWNLMIGNPHKKY